MNNLKVCSCGAKPTLWVDNGSSFVFEPTKFQVSCSNCCKTTEEFVDKNRAIDAWNKGKIYNY